MNTYTVAFRVYGAEGHRQKESFNKSYSYNFSTPENIRIIEVQNSDITGTNEFTKVVITRNTYRECKEEINGQITDGIFENCRTGKIIEVGV